MIEATDGIFDTVRATPSPMLDHDGDGLPDIVLTASNFAAPDGPGTTLLTLSVDELAAADGDDDGVIEVSDISLQAGSYTIYASDGSLRDPRSVADIDGDGRAELMFGSDDSNFISRTHLLLLPPGGGSIDYDPETGMPVCLTAGTRIAVPGGSAAVERLAPGDLVLTLDHGPQPLRWIGRRHLSAAELAAQLRFAPIRISAGALAPGLPERDLCVSPQHRMLLTGPAARRIGGSREILVAAKHLCGLPGIAPAALTAGVTYLHLLFDRHEIIFAEGAATESLHTGPVAIAALPPAARAEIFALFPDLAVGRQRPLARPAAPGRAARRFVRHCRPGLPLFA